jgi:hypothetical protein
MLGNGCPWMVMFIVFNAAKLRLKMLLRSGSNGSMRLSARFNAAELRFKGFNALRGKM